MFRNKKGDMTLNIIIAAAIAMVVLVVMLLIFTGRIKFFNQTCAENGGQWELEDNCHKPTGTLFDPTCLVSSHSDTTAGYVCCKKTCITPPTTSG